MKRLFTLILICVIAVSLSACGSLAMLTDLFNGGAGTDIKGLFEDKSVYLQVEPDELTYSEGYEPVISSYSYDALPYGGQKLLYEKLLDAYYRISPEIDEETRMYPMPQVEIEGYPMTEAQVRCAMKAIYDDHPDIFWASGTVGYYADDSSTIVQVYSNYSAEDVDVRVNAVRAVANEFYATVPDGLSEYERELLTHNFILDCASYKQDVDLVDLENNDPDIHTAYGVLVEGEAVCEGYARTFQMLMNGLGVDCVGISGKAEDLLHMWNAVRLGDSWYAVDVTWDDHDEEYYRYSYFNLTADQMAADHDSSPLFSSLDEDEINGQTGTYNSDVMNMYLPVCDDSSMGYYYRSSPRLTDYDGSEVKNALLSAALDQEEYLVFYIDGSLDYEEAVELLFSDYPQYFFSYISTVDPYLPDYSIDSSNVAYIKVPKNRIVAVELNYY